MPVATPSADTGALILGAGPAGLTAAYELSRTGVFATVIEKDDVVGGISRTPTYQGYHFDLGGHRFFTKVERVETLWKELLGDDLLHRERLSRIYYQGELFDYPLRPFGVLFGLSLWDSVQILASYARAQLFPSPREQTFEQWVCNRFGRRLFEVFFESYTEKVWGVPCSEISADWAAQRIRGLSLAAVVANAFSSRTNANAVKTLIERFHYPKIGPGMMWDAIAERAGQAGVEFRLQSSVEAVRLSGNRVAAVEVGAGDAREVLRADHVISSIPITELVQRIDPQPPTEVLDAAGGLRYRDFLIVVLIVDVADLFADNWIYIHDPTVRVGRIQNFKNWSPFMVPDPSKTCLGLEYFCFEGDELWCMADGDLVNLAQRELASLGLAKGAATIDGTVARVPKAYPIYDAAYEGNLEVIRRYLDGITNLQVVGRNGMHRYNNQDHSMLTAMLAAENVTGGHNDLWAVNVDCDYHEEVTPASEEVVNQTFSRMDPLAFAVATGSAAGLLLLMATLWLVFKGGDVVGPNMALLSQFLVGYSVTPVGALVGFGHGFVVGFLLGGIAARLRNFFLALLVYRLRRRLDSLTFRDVLGSF